MSLNEITWNEWMFICLFVYLLCIIMVVQVTMLITICLPEHWEFVDNWWLGLFAGNAIQTSAGKRLWILYTQMICFFFVYNEAGVLGCAEKLPSGSLAMTVVLRSTPPFLSSNTYQYIVSGREWEKKNNMRYMTPNNKTTTIIFVNRNV